MVQTDFIVERILDTLKCITIVFTENENVFGDFTEGNGYDSLSVFRLHITGNDRSFGCPMIYTDTNS